MSSYSHQNAPTQFTEARGIRFAYRRFGKRKGIPLVFFMHFTGTMDHWDPALTDGFAQDREVILFNNTGISSSSGEVPTSIEEMAQHAAAFPNASALKNSTLSDSRWAASSHSSSPSTGQTLSENSSSLALAQGVAKGWRR